jgi:hypothetical protein
MIEGYQLKLDNNFQYGQKNESGELRFVVYHDEERKPYQVHTYSYPVPLAFFCSPPTYSITDTNFLIQVSNLNGFNSIASLKPHSDQPAQARPKNWQPNSGLVMWVTKSEVLPKTSLGITCIPFRRRFRV